MSASSKKHPLNFDPYELLGLKHGCSIVEIDKGNLLNLIN